MHHTLKARCTSQPVHSVCWMEWAVWQTSRSPNIQSGNWWETMFWASAVSSAGNECPSVLWAMLQSSGLGRGWFPLSLAWYAAGLTWWKGRTLIWHADYFVIVEWKVLVKVVLSSAVWPVLWEFSLEILREMFVDRLIFLTFCLHHELTLKSNINESYTKAQIL
jgi:hypothetical protein